MSIRTLLILVAVCAVWTAYQSNRARDQRIAVRRILELGGNVTYDFEIDGRRNGVRNPSPPGWSWLRKIVGADFFQEAEKIHLDKTKVADADLLLIGRLKNVRSLSLNWTNISNPGLSHLSGLRNLRYLGLTESRVTDAGLRHLRFMRNLDTVILENTAVGNEACEHLDTLTRLNTLNLSGTQVTSSGIAKLSGHRKLASLWISNTEVDDAAVRSLARIGSLEEVQLSDTRLSGAGLLTLRLTAKSTATFSTLKDSTSTTMKGSPRGAGWQTGCTLSVMRSG